MNKNFYSILGPKIEAFIAHKVSIGIKYDGRIYYLYEFDKYCLENGNPNHLTKEILEGFIEVKIQNMNSKYKSWISMFRELSRYICLIDEKSTYILSGKYKIAHIHPNPYCLSDREITLFFNKCLQMYDSHDVYGRYLVIPTYFLLLYCTGIRNFECTRLKKKNVHLRDKYFDVIKSKDKRDRRIYLNEDIVDVLLKYDSKMEIYYPNRMYFLDNRFPF